MISENGTYSINERPKRFSAVSAVLVAIAIILSAALFFGGIYYCVKEIRTGALSASRAMQEENGKEAEDVDLSQSLRVSTVNRVIKDESIPAYSNAQVRAMDVSRPSGVTESDLKLVTKGNLKGLEGAFLKAEKDYGINCLFVMAIASHESANGTMCFRPNNMFGYGRSGFSSKAECIDVVSRALATKYLRPGASLYSGKTISSVNKRYAASTTWDDKVARNMTNYYSVISTHHNRAVNRLK